MRDTCFEFLNHAKNSLPASIELQSILNCLVLLVGFRARVKLNSWDCKKKKNNPAFYEENAELCWCLKCVQKKVVSQTLGFTRP